VCVCVCVCVLVIVLGKAFPASSFRVNGRGMWVLRDAPLSLFFPFLPLPPSLSLSFSRPASLGHDTTRLKKKKAKLRAGNEAVARRGETFVSFEARIALSEFLPLMEEQCPEFRASRTRPGFCPTGFFLSIEGKTASSTAEGG